MLDDLGMDLVKEARFCDAQKEYIESQEGKKLMQRMQAAEKFTLKERSTSEHDQKEYKHVIECLEKFAAEGKQNEQVVRLNKILLN